jgi:hypothetical protein
MLIVSASEAWLFSRGASCRFTEIKLNGNKLFNPWARLSLTRVNGLWAWASDFEN